MSFPQFFFSGNKDREEVGNTSKSDGMTHITVYIQCRIAVHDPQVPERCTYLGVPERGIYQGGIAQGMVGRGIARGVASQEGLRRVY